MFGFLTLCYCIRRILILLHFAFALHNIYLRFGGMICRQRSMILVATVTNSQEMLSGLGLDLGILVI